MCARVVGTLNQSDYTGVVHKGCAHRGCTYRGGGDTQPIRLHRDCMQGLHAQGLHMQGWWGHSANQITQGLHARVARRGCKQGLIKHGLRAWVACTGVARAVVPSLVVLGYHWLLLAAIDLVGDNREFEV